MFSVSAAAERLLAFRADEVAAETEVEAQFDTTQDTRLDQIRRVLSREGVRYSSGRNHIFHKSNRHAVVIDAQRSVSILDDLGFRVRVNKGIFEHSNYALKGNDRIVLQRIGNDLRIFFSA